MSDDDAEQFIKSALQELGDLELAANTPIDAKDLRKIILRQMELSHVLFDRQHKDVLKQIDLNRSFFERQHEDVKIMHDSIKEFAKSTKRVEKLTIGLIGLTVVLAGMTFLLIPR
jgi:hypothetical protein